MNEYWRQITLDRLRQDQPLIRLREVGYGEFDVYNGRFLDAMLQALAHGCPGFFPEASQTAMMDLLIGFGRIKKERAGRCDREMQRIIPDLHLIKNQIDSARYRRKLLRQCTAILLAKDPTALVYHGLAFGSGKVVDQLVINDSGIHLIWALPKLPICGIDAEGLGCYPENLRGPTINIGAILDMYAALVARGLDVSHSLPMRQVIVTEERLGCAYEGLTVTAPGEISSAIRAKDMPLRAEDKEELRVSILRRCRVGMVSNNVRQYERVIRAVADTVGILRE